MAKQRTKSSQKAPDSLPDETSQPDVLETANSMDIRVLAYHLWEARGCPEGSPELDWFQAEQQLREQPQPNGKAQVSEPLLTREVSA
jgi:hypothetical protein